MGLVADRFEQLMVEGAANGQSVLCLSGASGSKSVSQRHGYVK